MEKAIRAGRLNSLGEFIQALEERGWLARVKEPVDPDLEITAICDRMVKQGGPALLFERPVHRPGDRPGDGAPAAEYAYPVLINAFGTEERMLFALGVDSWEEIASRVEALLKPEIPKGLLQKISALPKLAELASFLPKEVKTGPVREVEEENPDLNSIPILKCWPKDAGRYITFGLTVTKDPETGEQNLGLYRIQVLDSRRCVMHWQTHKDGRSHCGKYRALGRKMPVAIVLGGDPATIYAASAPLPPGMDELLFAGFLRRSPVEVTRACGGELLVPARAEFILEGWVDPNELALEGPFGDHTGFYSQEGEFPVFHLDRIARRKNPIYLTTVVGRPPMEDYFLGRATERIFLPAIRTFLPEIVDMHFPAEGIFNNGCIVSLRKSYPGQARKVACGLWGMGQMSLTKILILVDEDCPPDNYSEVAFRCFNFTDPKRDFFFTEGPVDDLNFASPALAYGSKVAIDATRKLPAEGARPFPEEAALPAEVESRLQPILLRLLNHPSR